MPIVVAFVALAYALTWPIELFVFKAHGPDGMLLLAAAGPSIAGLLVTRRYEGVGGSAALHATFRIAPPALLVVVALLLPTALRALAGGIGAAAGAGTPWLQMPALVVALGAPLGEEIGWRGVMLPRLVPRLGLTGASIVVGVAWALWHLPAIFAPGAAPADFLPFAVGVVCASVIVGALWARGRRSPWIAMAAHAGLNLSLVGLPDAAVARAAMLGVLAVAAAVAAWATRAAPVPATMEA